MLVRRLHQRNVFSQWAAAAAQAAQTSTAQTTGRAQQEKRQQKLIFEVRARSSFSQVETRVLVWAVLEKLVLAHTGAQKFSKGEPALAPLKSSRQAGVCEEVEHCSSWQQHHTPPRNLLTWRPLLVKNQFENHAAKLISAFSNEVIRCSFSKLRSWSLTEGLRKGLLSEWERLN